MSKITIEKLPVTKETESSQSAFETESAKKILHEEIELLSDKQAEHFLKVLQASTTKKNSVIGILSEYSDDFERAMVEVQKLRAGK